MNPQRTPPVHLARGAPCVRSWSRYQKTDFAVSLCGIRRKKSILASSDVQGFVEGVGVTCEYCLDLAGQPRAAGGEF